MTYATDRLEKTANANALEDAGGCGIRGTARHSWKSGRFTPLRVGMVLGVAILAGAIIYHAYHALPESREALERQAGEMVSEILAENESFSTFFTVQKVDNCLLVKSGENSYSGSVDAICHWKAPAMKGKMRSFFIEAAGSDGGVRPSVVEEFERQLTDPMKFKFDVEMVSDGSRYSVSCTVADKQPSPAGKVVLALLGLGGDD